MSTIMRSPEEILAKGQQRKISEIPATIKSGTRMTRNQLHFCVVTAVVLVLVLFLVMVIAGNKADSVVSVNEEVQVLQDADAAERIIVKEGKFLEFAEGSPKPAEGQRTILNEKITTSKNYWVTLSSDEEIAAFEAVIGEERFIQIEKLGNNSLWLVMGTDDEMAKCNELEGAAIVPINNITDNAWLQKGTDEDNLAAEAAYNNIRFIQFERLGQTHVRLRRGLESEIQKIDEKKISQRGLRLIILLLAIIAAGALAYVMKSEKVLKKPESFQKMLRTIFLIAGIVFLAAAVFLTVQMDKSQDEMVRAQSVIVPVDGQSAEDVIVEDETETITPDSGEKFHFATDKGVPATASIPQTASGLSGHRIVKYVAMVLLGLLVFGLLYLFQHERDLGFPMFNTVILIILMMITIYPVLNTLATSFNDGTDALRGGIGVLPRKFSMKSYDNILSKQEIFDAAWVSASKTVIITILNLFWTGMLSYTLSRKEYVLRKLITTLMVLTMYVNAGLIPSYLLISQTLNLAHTYWVYIIPTMMSCFNMIVIRTYIGGLPDALVESAKIDGAGDFRIYWKIIFPLCTPVLATVALFVAVGSWNSWFDTRLYNAGQKDPKTLQYLLQMKILTAGQNSNAANTSTDALKVASKTEPITIRAAITVISTLPILVVYPFLQKYFVTGMALGSVKG